MEEQKKRCIATERLCDTGFSYTLSLISGKYKMTILDEATPVPNCSKRIIL